MNTEQTALELLELEQIPDTAWELLREGVNSARSPLHTPCLGTLGANGPSLRTVVLRHCDEPQRLIGCHSDGRSAKVREVKREPQSSWLFYDRDRKLQLRLAGPVSVHLEDNVADRAWANTRAMGRACYNATTGPGQFVPQPATAPSRISAQEEEQSARGHFAVIACRIDFIDWLLLSAKGHRRAQFQWSGEGWTGHWVSP